VARLLGAALEATTVMVPGAARMIPITHPEAVVHALRREVVSQTEAKENDHERSPGGHEKASAIPFEVPDERANRSHNDRKGKGRNRSTRYPCRSHDGAVAAGSAGMIVSRRRHHMADTTVQRTSELLYLDDLHVGRRFTSGTHALDERQITAFASEFDPQPFHMDREAAKATLFGGLAASGWHTAAITMRLQVDGGLPIAGGIVGLGGEVAWPRATRPGDVLHVESEVVEVVPSRSRPDRGTVTVRSETRNQRGEVVQTATVKLLIPRRSKMDSADSKVRTRSMIGKGVSYAAVTTCSFR